MSGEPLLSVKDLRVIFRGPDGAERAVVDGLSFDVLKGSWTSLVGRSGSGKSVTAQLALGLTRPHRVSGGLYWFGGEGHKDLLHASEAELRRVRGRQIAYIFQDAAAALDPVMTIGAQLAEVSADKGAVRDVLAGLRLPDIPRVLKSYPHELSGGMKQRIQIAMALLPGASLLIADEPTTAQDPTTQAEIIDGLKELTAAGQFTLLFITHDLGLAKAVSDSIVVLENGRAVAQDSHEARRLFSAATLGARPKQRIPI